MSVPRRADLWSTVLDGLARPTAAGRQPAPADQDLRFKKLAGQLDQAIELRAWKTARRAIDSLEALARELEGEQRVAVRKVIAAKSRRLAAEKQKAIAPTDSTSDASIHTVSGGLPTLGKRH